MINVPDEIDEMVKILRSEIDTIPTSASGIKVEAALKRLEDLAQLLRGRGETA